MAGRKDIHKDIMQILLHYEGEILWILYFWFFEIHWYTSISAKLTISIETKIIQSFKKKTYVMFPINTQFDDEWYEWYSGIVV